METKRDLLNHFKWLQDGVAQVQGEAFLNLQSFTAEVRLGNRVHLLFPHFVVLVDGNTLYSSEFSHDVIRFAGWRPTRRIEPFSFARKLKFKELLEQNGIPTPAFSFSDGKTLNDVLIKKDISSFGADIKGPYRSSSDAQLDVAQGEFFERFAEGRIVKVWFWNHRPVCVEMKSMPEVIGDGRSSIKDLVLRKPTRLGDEPRLEPISELLRFYSKTLDTVLPQGNRQLIDFRYTSQFGRPQDVVEVDLSAARDLRFDRPLRSLGELLYGQLLQESRPLAAYSVDAILDSQDKLWFLEANPNPFIHPLVYPHMIRGLADMQQQQQRNHLVAVAGGAMT